MSHGAMDGLRFALSRLGEAARFIGMKCEVFAHTMILPPTVPHPICCGCDHEAIHVSDVDSPVAATYGVTSTNGWAIIHSPVEGRHTAI